MNKKRGLTLLVCLASLLMLTSCNKPSSKQDFSEEIKNSQRQEDSVQELFEEVFKHIKRDDYQVALVALEKMEESHPNNASITRLYTQVEQLVYIKEAVQNKDVNQAQKLCRSLMKEDLLNKHVKAANQRLKKQITALEKEQAKQVAKQETEETPTQTQEKKSEEGSSSKNQPQSSEENKSSSDVPLMEVKPEDIDYAFFKEQLVLYAGFPKAVVDQISEAEIKLGVDRAQEKIASQGGYGDMGYFFVEMEKMYPEVKDTTGSSESETLKQPLSNWTELVTEKIKQVESDYEFAYSLQLGEESEGLQEIYVKKSETNQVLKEPVGKINIYTGEMTWYR